MAFDTGPRWNRRLGADVMVRMHDNTRLRDGCNPPRDIRGRGFTFLLLRSAVWPCLLHFSCQPDLVVVAHGKFAGSSPEAHLVYAVAKATGATQSSDHAPDIGPAGRKLPDPAAHRTGTGRASARRRH